MRDGAREAKRQIDKLLKDNLRRSMATPVFYAVGGGWRALAKVHMAIEQAPVPVVHGYTCDAQVIRDFAKYLMRLSPAKLAGLPGMSERRARTTLRRRWCSTAC